MKKLFKNKYNNIQSKMFENVTTNNLCIVSCFNDNNNGTIFRECCSIRDSEISDDKTNLQKENGIVDDFEINKNVQNIMTATILKKRGKYGWKKTKK